MRDPRRPITSPATVGILGSGQLGRMLALAARRMGYRVHVLSPESDSPTGQVADREWAAPYDDLDAVRAFARSVDVVTYEFENVPAATAAAAAEFAPLRPGATALHVAQNRLREKEAFSDAGLAVAPFAPVRSRADLAAGLAAIGAPAVVKTTSLGYDGKGQFGVDSAESLDAVWQALAGREALIEQRVDLRCEISVVAARGVRGGFAHFGVIENVHRNHILDVSSYPAAVSDRLRDDAVGMARAVLAGLNVVGVMCVEFFVTTDDRLLVNEIAPRPHNSGHLTIDACVTDQFEQQLRAVCGLPLGATTYHSPAAMVNLLGDLWADGEPDWAAALAEPRLKLHLYGKHTPRIGRKMGHLTATAPTAAEARRLALAARDRLRTNHPQ